MDDGPQVSEAGSRWDPVEREAVAFLRRPQHVVRQVAWPDPPTCGLKSQPGAGRNALEDKGLRVSAESPSAPLQRACGTAETAPKMPPDLAKLVAAWHRLPRAIRAGIVAMVSAAATGY